MNKNQRLHELLGGCWHVFKIWACRWTGQWTEVLEERCGKCGVLKEHGTKNPDYCDDPRLVMLTLLKIDLFLEFARWCEKNDHAQIEDQTLTVFWEVSLILDRTGKLADLVVEWLEREGEES